MRIKMFVCFPRCQWPGGRLSMCSQEYSCGHTFSCFFCQWFSTLRSTSDHDGHDAVHKSNIAGQTEFVKRSMLLKLEVFVKPPIIIKIKLAAGRGGMDLRGGLYAKILFPPSSNNFRLNKQPNWKIYAPIQLQTLLFPILASFQRRLA